MFFDLFAASAILGWLVIGVICIILIVATDTESYVAATFTLLVTILFLEFFTDTRPIEYAFHNPLTAISAFIVYFVVGSVWCLVKWYFHCLRAADKYKEKRDQWLMSNNVQLESLTALQKQQMLYELGYSVIRSSNRHDVIPLASKNKARIYGWIVYWPFSAAWTVLNDPIRRIGLMIYNRLAGSLQIISNKIFTSRFKELS